jgi:hypothetical protein
LFGERGDEETVSYYADFAEAVLYCIRRDSLYCLNEECRDAMYYVSGLSQNTPLEDVCRELLRQYTVQEVTRKLSR